jgi:hypothetical protein
VRESLKKMQMGWWGNKPPVHRSLVRMGFFSTVGLIIFGIVLDIGLLGQKAAIPSLSPFIWDLAKGTTLGTITLAILDDVRSWGVGWKILQAESTSVSTAADNLISTFLKLIGLKSRISHIGGGVEYSAEYADRVAEWTHALESEFYEFLRPSSRENLSPPPSPFEDWSKFSSVLEKANMLVPLSWDLSEEFNPEAATEELSKAASQLSDALKGIRPATSTGVSSQIGDLLSRLTIFPVAAASFAEVVHELSAGKGPRESNSRQNKLRGNEVGPISNTMYRLKSVLELLDYERKTGRPHPFRPRGIDS